MNSNLAATVSARGLYSASISMSSAEAAAEDDIEKISCGTTTCGCGGLQTWMNARSTSSCAQKFETDIITYILFLWARYVYVWQHPDGIHPTLMFQHFLHHLYGIPPRSSERSAPGLGFPWHRRKTFATERASQFSLDDVLI